MTVATDRVRPLTPLPNDTDMWVNVQGRDVPGRVNSSYSTPRSYIIETPTGHFPQPGIQVGYCGAEFHSEPPRVITWPYKSIAAGHQPKNILL